MIRRLVRLLVFDPCLLTSAYDLILKEIRLPDSILYSIFPGILPHPRFGLCNDFTKLLQIIFYRFYHKSVSTFFQFILLCVSHFSPISTHQIIVMMPKCLQNTQTWSGNSDLHSLQIPGRWECIRCICK